MAFPDCAQFSISLWRTSPRLKHTLVDLFIPRATSGLFQRSPMDCQWQRARKDVTQPPMQPPMSSPKTQAGGVRLPFLACTLHRQAAGRKQKFPSDKELEPLVEEWFGAQMLCSKEHVPFHALGQCPLSHYKKFAQTSYSVYRVLCVLEMTQFQCSCGQENSRRVGSAPPKKSHAKRERIFSS